ncbi:hypothetical protein EV187_1144 [Agromyces ramosus]|uniref:Uncharacterized protein n=1 Tax=Agromyces ramosus TaxID=33879 RepID=A0A4Q7MPR6_9MICO|nr:hypothetical protein [Agromyces ramosus]RZS68709.1 hypothetical protein EV187_1144 [Agromyces ramosus]
MNELTSAQRTPDPLSDRRAVQLLLAFVAAVVIVLALATVPLSITESMTTREPTGQRQLDRFPR